VKPGFIFEGWYDNEELTGDSISKVPDGVQVMLNIMQSGIPTCE
jgi:uncharacterized repeat protein (TIGR02543 family)